MKTIKTISCMKFSIVLLVALVTYVSSVGQGMGESTVFGNFEVCYNATEFYSTDYIPESPYEYYWVADGGTINGSNTNSTVSVTWNSTNPSAAIKIYSRLIGTSTTYLEGQSGVTITQGSGGTVGNVTVCQGTTSSVTVSGYSGNIIRWEKSTNSGGSWSTINHTGATLTIGTSHSNSDRYRAVSENSCSAFTSTAGAVTVFNPAYMVQLSSSWICPTGESGSFGIEGGSAGAYVIKWQKKDGDAGSGNPWVDYSFNQTCTYSVTQTTSFKAIISNGPCGTTENTITIQGVTHLAAGNITPASQTVCSSLSNASALTLSGAVGNIQWQYFQEASQSWQPTGNGSTTLSSFPSITAGAVQQVVRFRASISNSCGTANTDEVTVTLDPATNAGTVTTPNSSYCGSQTVRFTLTSYVGSILNWSYRSKVGNGSFSSWSTISSTASFIDQNIGPSGSTPVTYEYQAIVKSGVCTSSGSVVRTVVMNPIPNASASGQSICSMGDTGITITNPNAVAGTTFNWVSSQYSGATISGHSSANGSFINQTLTNASNVDGLVQ
jgi:hypothetical protein